MFALKNPLISSVRLYPFNIALKEPFAISIETLYSAENVLVEITTTNGVTGYGECSPFLSILGETQQTCLAAGKLLAKGLLGKRVVERERNAHILASILAGNTCIKSAFDMAIHDVAAQIAGLPLYRFLGGSGDKVLRTDMTVGLSNPEKMASDAVGFVRQGFDTIKVKLGTNPADDHQRIRLVRQAIGEEVALRVDANQGWDEMTALKVLRELAGYRVDYCEQPTQRWNIPAMANITRQSPIPVMADESLFDHHDAYHLLRNNACHFFNIKLAKTGSIGSAMKINAIADAAGYWCQIGCFMESKIGITAAAHLALAASRVVYFDLDSPLMHAEDPVIQGITYGHGGLVQVNEEPGLGVKVDPDFLRKLPAVVVD